MKIHTCKFKYLCEPKNWPCGSFVQIFEFIKQCLRNKLLFLLVHFMKNLFRKSTFSLLVAFALFSWHAAGSITGIPPFSRHRWTVCLLLQYKRSISLNGCYQPKRNQRRLLIDQKPSQMIQVLYWQNKLLKKSSKMLIWSVISPL